MIPVRITHPSDPEHEMETAMRLAELDAHHYLTTQDVSRLERLQIVARRDLRRSLASGSDADVERNAVRAGGLTTMLAELRADLRQTERQRDLLLGRVPGGRVIRPGRVRTHVRIHTSHDGRNAHA